MRARDIAAAGLIALAVSGGAILGSERLGWLSTDLLFWLRHHSLATERNAADSPVVVVAIDEETYRRPPFRDLPKVLWTQRLAAVVEQLLDAEVTVIGWDVIFPASVQQHLPGFDRELLLALRRGAETGRIVLGKAQHSEQPILPFAGYRIAVGRGRNLHAVNLLTDGDGVVRRVPLTFESRNPGGDASGGTETGFALELARRASGGELARTAAGGLTLGGRPIPGSEANAMTPNFDGAPGAIPTYSLADLNACVEAGGAAYFRAHFAGKTVILGTALDVEDRHLTSKRLIAGAEAENAPERCALEPMAGLAETGGATHRRDSIPGVYIQATAVANLLRGEELRRIEPLARNAIILAFTALISILAMTTGALRAGLGFAAGSAVWIAACTGAFSAGLILPLLSPLASGAASLALLLGYRFSIADRDKHRLRRAFSLYLPPSEVDRMIRSGQLPALGGEARDVTIWFSDIAGFTKLSEGMDAVHLVTLLNVYFSEMAAIIESHGGIVDKYMGDGIIAIFGAPLADPDHARHAIEAALACGERLDELNRTGALPGGATLQARVGINTGAAVVGNIGSAARFNYTVIGDAVNLAARLEGANKAYGTRILISETTVEAAGHAAAEAGILREIDLIRVVGRSEPVRVFEPLPKAQAQARDGAPPRAWLDFAQALEAFRAGRFLAAADGFKTLAPADPVAARFLDRALELSETGPGGAWDAVHDLSQK